MSRCGRGASLVLAAVWPLASCSPAPEPAPGVPADTPSAPATASASSTPATPAVDLTAPGAARRVVDELMDTAGANRAIMVAVTEREAAVAVVRGGVAETWGYRDGTIGPVASDINYVSQASFDPADFALDDVGALFRAGRAVAGADSAQELQVVDYSGGFVAMTVTTNPESRTVFFNADGTLLATLDFTSVEGLRAAYGQVVGPRTEVTQLGFGSEIGVYVDVPSEGGTLSRRQRTARTPVIVTTRTEPGTPAPFDPALVSPDVVWQVVSREREAGRYSFDEPWNCVVARPAVTATPRLTCSVGAASLTTDLRGNRVDG